MLRIALIAVARLWRRARLNLPFSNAYGSLELTCINAADLPPGIAHDGQ